MNKKATRTTRTTHSQRSALRDASKRKIRRSQKKRTGRGAPKKRLHPLSHPPRVQEAPVAAELAVLPVAGVLAPAACETVPILLHLHEQRSPWDWGGGSRTLLPTGVNLIGLIRSEMGIGQSSRLAAAALDEAGVPFGVIDVPGVSPARSLDHSWLHKEIVTAPYPVNLFHLNADNMSTAHAYFGSKLFEDRYNIGYWHWELPDFPDEHVTGFEKLQEIWVPSQFVFESLVRKSPVSVVKIPHGIAASAPVFLPREYFGLPCDAFLFLSMYDTHSFMERKNPKATIEAFLRAFPQPVLNQVGLVIKINNPDKQGTEQLKELIGGRPDIHVLPQVLSRLEMNALLQSIQCFVSLHRSEGFGLGLAEAMALGKPVIGTYWSGNTEFMHTDNSCAVDFKLIHVGIPIGPYQPYQLWADPDLDHAAYYMKRLIKEPAWRQTIAKKGKHTIRTYFSPLLAGQRMAERLAQLGF